MERSGDTFTPTPAVSVIDALARPSSTSTDACPVSNTITTIGFDVASSCTAIAIDALPDAIAEVNR